MQIIKSIAGMRQSVASVRSAGIVGLVPTMGALHAGHISLIRRTRAECGVVAASIFVNPLQFAANEDLAKYPRTFEEDCEQLEREGVDLLFAPTSGEMYPARAGMGLSTRVDPGPIGGRLDGLSRPGHFTGVATVVAKLFNIIQPDRAYFGQKDAAQLAVLRQMARDLNFPIELIGCPIVRDEDGLALSSRNRYLNADESARALELSRTLRSVAARIEAGERNSSSLLGAAVDELRTGGGIGLDYLAIVDPDTLLPATEAVPGSLIAIAARVGETRLIDNVIAP